MNKRTKIIYYTSTILLTLLFIMGPMMYFFNHDEVALVFEKLGYPTYLIYPLATIKLLGVVAIWTNKSAWLKEWAYAGFFFDLVLALGAHVSIGDGEYAPAIVGIVLVLTSYFTGKRLNKSEA